MFEPIRKDKKEYSSNTRNADDFLNQFHQKLRVYVKENKTKKSIDYQVLTHHLNTLAKRAKKRKMESFCLLKRVAEIIIYTCSGR